MKTLVPQIMVALICLATVARADSSNRASQILTADLAQKILGAAVEPGSKNATADTEMGKIWVSSASYSVSGGGATASRVTVLIRHADTADQAKTIFESSKGTFKGVDVPGIGDSAYRTQIPAQLDVLKGNCWIIITAGTGKTADSGLQEKTAREILPKIPSS